MRVYVETNFVLELVLEQEQQPACDEIVRLAETSSIALLLPAFSLAEPFSTLRRRQIERQDLKDRLARELREIRRTQQFTAEEQACNAVLAMLVRSAQEAEVVLHRVSRRLAAAAQLLPLTAEVLAQGTLHQRSFGLSPPDALVLASLLSDPGLGSEPACFLNRNVRDFGDPAVEALLDARACKTIGHFEHGLKYIRSHKS